MLDEFCTFHYPPCHELLRLEKFQLFLSCFLGKNVADAYQVSPCLDKGVQGIDLSIQAYATFLGKCFELRPGFIRTSEGVYSGWRSLDYLFFLHVNDY